ncbi:hypothetical protein GN956_G8994 [Arapaima gigas]
MHPGPAATLLLSCPEELGNREPTLDGWTRSLTCTAREARSPHFCRKTRVGLWEETQLDGGRTSIAEPKLNPGDLEET